MKVPNKSHFQPRSQQPLLWQLQLQGTWLLCQSPLKWSQNKRDAQGVSEREERSMKENEIITTSSGMQNVTELLYLAALLLGGLLSACL